MAESTKAVKKTIEKQKRIKKIKVGEVVTLDSGVQIKYKKVAAWLLRDVSQNVDLPDLSPFMYDDPATSKKELNANHPGYRKAMAAYEQEKEEVQADALVQFGMELVTPLPPKEEWISGIEWLEKKGRLDLSAYDLNHNTDLEILYKKYVIGDLEIVKTLSSLSTVSEEGIAAEADSFPSD